MRYHSIATLGTLLALAGSAHGQGTFTPLGDLPGGATESRAFDVSGDGRVVVGWSMVASGLEAFMWTPEDGMIGLGDLPGGDTTSSASGVSDDGAVVVGSSGGVTGYEPFRWSLATGMVGLGDPFDSEPNAYGFGISGDGKVIVGMGFLADGEREALAWTSDGGYLGLGDLPGGRIHSSALGASTDGSVIVGEGSVVSDTGPDRAFRWTAQTGMIDLGFLAENEKVSARAIDDDGSVIIGAAFLDGRSRAVRWVNGQGPLDLGEFPGGEYEIGATDVTGDGSLIVGNASFGNEATRRAWIWDEQHGFRDFTDLLTTRGLLPEGWTLHRIYGCSADGRHFAGYGTNPQGTIEAYLVSSLDLSCYADFTGDGALDLFDFLGYVNAFNEANGAAECDGDQGLTLFDFLCFVNKFNGGC